MMKFTSLLIVLFTSVIAYSQQEKCLSPDESIADPNSITKCAIEKADDGKKRQLSIRVSTRRRIVRKKSKATSVTGDTKNQKVASLKKNTLLVGKLELEDNSETIEKIPFNLVEEIPLFSKCNNVPLVKQAKCFEKQMSKHIQRNFVYPKEALEAGIQGRVSVLFTIDTEGNVEDFQVRAPKNGESLKKEAIRIVKKLPKFIPGKHNGKVVKVKYGIPLTFKHPDAKNLIVKKIKKQPRVKIVRKIVSKTEKSITDFVKFSDVQTIPQFKACSKVADSEKGNCFNERMISHIQRNFNYPSEAVDHNIEGKVLVNFIINKQGKVSNIRMRGPQNGEILEEEAKRMISRLSTFIPGTQDGKAVNVQYQIPINFKLEN